MLITNDGVRRFRGAEIKPLNYGARNYPCLTKDRGELKVRTIIRVIACEICGGII